MMPNNRKVPSSMAKSRPQHAGNVNMKGRRTMRYRCGCCDCVDLRVPLEERRRRSEALSALLESDADLYDKGA